MGGYSMILLCHSFMGTASHYSDLERTICGEVRGLSALGSRRRLDLAFPKAPCTLIVETYRP